MTAPDATTAADAGDQPGLRTPGWGTLRVRGPEARTWLNGLLTCNVEGVTLENGVWGLLLNKRGKIVCDLTIIADAEGLWLGSGSGIQTLFELLDSYLVMEDAEIEVAQGYAWLTLYGPGAVARACSISSVAVGAVAWSRGEGAAVLVPEARASECVRQLTSEFGARMLDAAAWSALRVRLGLPEFGVDFGLDDNPHEAGLDRRTVDWSKGCYLGQEVVCMQDMRGKVKRRLARLEFDARARLTGGEQLSVGQQVLDPKGSEVGQVTSATEPEAGAAIAIARLKAPFFEPGTSVLVGEQRATVLELLAETP